jgi:hypothetical protein
VKKSTLIATFLVNLGSGFDLDQAEYAVAVTFAEKYLASDFHAWNTELDDGWCENVIKGEPNPSYVNVENFILRLWDMR